MKAKKLIEVAMPIKEISAESVRDKSIRHGHISTLHLWWARRPLPTCRAVVFASLVPDPLDPNCPQAFKDAVYNLLHGEGIEKALYAPYSDIPYTSVHDQMEDNLRNRLLMFIGKFSNKCQENMLAGKTTSPKDQLIDRCLIKWESKNDEWVLGKARKLIWVAYNSERFPEKSYIQLSNSFESSYNAIKLAEDALYSIENRHQRTTEVINLEEALHEAIENFQNNMPSVLDPFAGGGAIPLEAARLGCRSFGNDINPVAHIIEKGSAEFPQKYGKPITYTHEIFDKLYGPAGWELLKEKDISQINASKIEIPNRLSFDVEYYGRKVISQCQTDLLDKNLYKSNSLVYYWVRTAKCSNPSCGAEVPMMKQFYISKCRNAKAMDYVYLNPHISGNQINFSIAHGECKLPEWNKRCNLTCPCCGSVTTANDIKQQFASHNTGERLVAIISESKDGKRKYSIPSAEDLAAIDAIERVRDIPSELMPQNDSQNVKIPLWGYKTYGDMFSDRQSIFISSLASTITHVLDKISFDDNQYHCAIATYLTILFDRVICRNTSFGVWHKLQETIEQPFGKNAIHMVFDYPEMNPFSNLSSSCLGQLDPIISYIESESSFAAIFNNSSSGEKSQFAKKSITSVITDPPYYDAIAYADLSDFFYVWQKRLLAKYYPFVFSTPKTPKAEECTAIKSHHNNDEFAAKTHFENKLTTILKAIEIQTSDIVSIMFAHQSTKAWSTLCNSILEAHMNITGSWALDTEVSAALKAEMDTLESSVTVACRPSEKNGFASFKKVKDAIRDKVSEEVRALYGLGFRGPDLLTACFGKAVGEFGNYENVEKSDGSEVTVAELLELARTSAFTALLRDFTGDDYTKFYIGWLQMNGMGDTDFDDATKFTRVGMNVNIGDIQRALLLIKDEDSRKQHLASYKERGGLSLRNMSEDKPLIDKVHLAMKLWESGERNYLLPFIAQYGNDINNEFWRVLVVLKELLPATSEDFVQANGLLQNADNLIKDSKNYHGIVEDGPSLFDNLD